MIRKAISLVLICVVFGLQFSDMQAQTVLQGTTISTGSRNNSNNQGSSASQTNSVATTGGSCVNITRPLATGASGSDVTSLQQFLIRGGFLAADLGTGYYGARTTQAVASYQTARGIEATGTVGPITRARIASESCAQGSGSGIGINGVTVSSAPIPTKAPTIKSIVPKSATIGDQVTLTGTDFHPHNNTVLFGGVGISSLGSPDGKKLTFFVPDITQSCESYTPSGCDYEDGLSPGENNSGHIFQVYVSNHIALSNTVSMTVVSGILKPSRSNAPVFTSFFSPSVLKLNETGYWTMTIKHPAGKSVSLRAVWGDQNSQSAGVIVGRFTSRGENRLTISHKYTQAGRFSPKFIVVDDDTESSTTRTANRVTVSATVVSSTAAPKITSVSPTKAKVGDTVTIVGTGFSSSNNTIYFGPGVITGVESYNSGTMLFFTVPAYINPCDSIISGTCSVGTVPIVPNQYRIVVSNGAGKQTGAATLTVTR